VEGVEVFKNWAIITAKGCLQSFSTKKILNPKETQKRKSAESKRALRRTNRNVKHPVVAQPGEEGEKGGVELKKTCEVVFGQTGPATYCGLKKS